MIDKDLTELTARLLDHPLEGLESAIWARVALRAEHRVLATRRVAFQGTVMALAIVGSIALGIHATRVPDAMRTHTLFAFGLELAPSNLLLNRAR